MTGLRIYICYRRIIGAGNRYAGCGFRGCPISIGHHITHSNGRTFAISQAVEITARRKLQLVISNADRTLTAYRITLTINDLHTVQTEAGCITIHISIIGQYVNRKGFVLMACLYICIGYRPIIGAGDRYTGRGFGGCPVSIRYHVTHGDGRAFAFGQTVKITARRKLQLIINNADRTLAAYRITLAINDLHTVQAKTGRIIPHISIIGQHINREGFIFMAGLRVHIGYWRVIGTSNCYAGRGFGCHPFIIRHHITHSDCRAFTFGQTVKITARRKLQLIVNDTDRALTT